MREKLKKFFVSCYQKTRLALGKVCAFCAKKIETSYVRCREGEERLKTLLIYWCMIPFILYFVVMFKIGVCPITRRLLDLFAIILSALDLFFIQKTVKKHPEYNTELVRAREKEAYYASLNPEELARAKADEKKENTKNFFKGLFLMGGTRNRIDAYKIVRLFVLLALVVSLKRLLM
ncbi:hypothetical protein FACS1894152_3310 [Bacilli bacterium]|nr:hypothetical protein FACS1894152_3310 [Bacilli bacterium]